MPRAGRPAITYSPAWLADAMDLYERLGDLKATADALHMRGDALRRLLKASNPTRYATLAARHRTKRMRRDHWEGDESRSLHLEALRAILLAKYPIRTMTEMRDEELAAILRRARVVLGRRG